MQNKNNNDALKIKKRGKFSQKLHEKLEMYDMIIANLIAGNAIIPPDKHIGDKNIQIGFSNISSDTQISKYFMIRQFPDYVQSRLIDEIRNTCIKDNVKINFYMDASPYKIDWDSAEMRNRMNIWRKYAEENSGSINAFDYRERRESNLTSIRMIKTTKYLNDAELNQKRSFMLVTFIIEVAAANDEQSIINMMESIKLLKEVCSSKDIKIKELRVNLIDWLQRLSPFGLQDIPEINSKLSKRLLSDDLLANFNSYKQGRIGSVGVPLGMDVESKVPVIRHIKADPDAAENWLISAGTGGGKSYWIKVLLTYLLADNFVVTVMDYEGDEYSNIAAYISDGNPDDVKVISMGKGSTTYFDPCEIPELTGDNEVDIELKEQAINYIIAIFKVIVNGLDGDLDIWEQRVISLAIKRMYDSVGITDDMNTWHRSKGLTLNDVYDELKTIVETRELFDSDSENAEHKAAVKVYNAASIYFEPGESRYGTFKNPMPASELYGAKFIVFSFGMKGESGSHIDPTLLALKQLSVASVSIQISNYCKYIRHCFNVKVWEEFQRWGTAKGSSDIIVNSMTGGRKRGDVNFIITNDLANILDPNNPISAKLSQNIQNFAIGRIPHAKTRKDFCDTFDMQDCRLALEKIAKAYTSDNKATTSQNIYSHSFCIIMDNGKKAIVKAMIPDSLAESKLFKTGVILDE
ncbi:MAG: DUF87 domain-containing protein [Lachnospiraceae bacterium]|nr:DUF87 domain-containing protein [Lachnospiraceae bacterium]